MLTRYCALYVLLAALGVSAAMRTVAYSYGTDPSSANWDFSRCSHVVGSFVLSDSAGNLAFDEWIPEADISSVLHKAAAAGAVPMVALGTTSAGWEMTKSATARATFITNIIAWCQTNGVKGIDLDLEGTAEEYNWGSPGTFFPAPYESLAVELRAAMPDTMLLSAAVGSFARNGPQWTDRFIAALDFINVMIYDRALSWEESPVENHSTFDGQVTAAAYWHGSRGLAKEKINLGVPFYARAWDRDNNRIYMENPGWEAATWDYKDFIDREDIPADQDTLDFPATDSILYPRAPGIIGKGTLFFNGRGMIARKTAWAVDSGYGGMMIWHIGGDVPTADSRSLLRAIDSVINAAPVAVDAGVQGVSHPSRIQVKGNMIAIAGMQGEVKGKWSLLSLDGRIVQSGKVRLSQGRGLVYLRDMTAGAGYRMFVLEAGGKRMVEKVLVE